MAGVMRSALAGRIEVLTESIVVEARLRGGKERAVSLLRARFPTGGTGTTREAEVEVERDAIADVTL